MTKIFTCLALCTVFCCANAQTQGSNVKNSSAVVTTQPYGKVDMADLQMTSCDFEKDANAEILFDKGVQSSFDQFGLNLTRHIRIKIFNINGKNEANIRLIYGTGAVGITHLRAETINLTNNKLEITPLDKKQIFTESINKLFSAQVFAMPNVRAGSIIEYEYTCISPTTWYFQGHLPTRYSEIQTDFSPSIKFTYIPHVYQPFVKNIGGPTDYNQVKALANVHSLPDEIYMSSREDNLQRMEFLVRESIIASWSRIDELLLKFSNFGDEVDYNVAGAAQIVKNAASLNTEEKRIAFLFDTVKSRMKWNGVTTPFVVDGTVKAWRMSAGNSAEINLIVYQLLRKAGIAAKPLIVSTKQNGKINPIHPSPFQFNNVLVFVPIDSARSYILDATNRFNLYNTKPENELNTWGIIVDRHNNDRPAIFIESTEPTMQFVFLNASVKPNGKIEGTAEITSFGYNKAHAMQKYKTDGEKKYIDYLRNNDNNLKISAIKMENMAIDSLPLTQKLDFSTDLPGSDDTYIYLGTNFFNGIGKNPFTGEERYSDIDFGYRDNYSINGIYKLPAGYKTDALPKTITIVSPDQSMIFKRTIIEDNGTIVVRYVLNHAKTIYFKKDYPDIRVFYKKMYELLNEQIVIKKA